MNAPPGYPPGPSNGSPPGYAAANSGYGSQATGPASGPPAYGQPAGGFGPAPAPAYGQAPGYGPPPAYGQASGYGPPPAYGQAPGYGPPPQQFGYQQGFGGQQVYGAQPPATAGAPSLRWFVLGSFLGGILLMVIGGAIGAAAEGEEVATTIGTVLTLIGLPLLLAYFVTALMWIYKSWEMLPESLRVTGNGTRVSPGAAVGYLFIPFYNLYWLFVCSSGLCTALNRALAAYGSPKRASNGLAVTAGVFHLLPYINALSPFLWIAYMLNVESAKREYARLAAAGGQQPLV